jgi:hypothetical protein
MTAPGSVWSVAAFTARAIPKSVSNACCSPSISTLAGFRSRCTTPAACAAASPAQICLAIARALDWQLAVGAQQAREILAFHVRHREVLDRAEFPEVVDANHVRMGDLAGQPQLTLESLFQLLHVERMGPFINPDDLQGDRGPERLIPGLVHGTHPSDPERADDGVAAAELVPGSEYSGARPCAEGGTGR